MQFNLVVTQIRKHRLQQRHIKLAPSMITDLHVIIEREKVLTDWWPGLTRQLRLK